MTEGAGVGAPPLAPTTASERIHTLDLLRGFAMFGVLWANLNTGYGVKPPASGIDRALAWAQQNLLDGRFYTLLGFLFGIGFSIQLARAESRGRDLLRFHMRRMAVLLGIGLVHGLLIWRGDILTLYAVIGMLLVPYRRLSQRGLLIAALVTFVTVSAVQRFGEQAGVVPATLPSSVHADSVYAHGSTREIFAQRASDYGVWYTSLASAALAGFLTLFILGVWVGRAGIVQRLRERRSTLRRALVTAILCCAGGFLLRHYLNLWWPHPASPPAGLLARALLLPRFLAGLVAGNLAVWAMSAIYAASLALLYQREGWARRLAPLVAVGRMTLTTYVTQSIVCTLLFYHYGLGWYGRASYRHMLALAVVLFGLQIWFCRWWLSRFRFGPVEWLWRSLSYGRRQPMKLTAR